MKNLQELYAEIIGSDELKQAYLEAAKGGKVADFLKAQGCEATAEEIKAFLKEKSNQQLSDEELDSVAGGACNHTTGCEVVLSCTVLGCIVDVILSASSETGHMGQKKDDEGRICNNS